MKFGLTTTQWDLLWTLVSECDWEAIDRESVEGFLGFRSSTINSLVEKGYINQVFYANGEHISISDAGEGMLKRFADDGGE